MLGPQSSLTPHSSSCQEITRQNGWITRHQNMSSTRSAASLKEIKEIHVLTLWITASVPNQTYGGTAEQNFYLPFWPYFLTHVAVMLLVSCSTLCWTVCAITHLWGTKDEKDNLSTGIVTNISPIATVFYFQELLCFRRELKSIWCFLWKPWNTILWYGGLAWFVMGAQ